jgi:DNA-binding PadR family transcriptional regulator
MVITITVIYSDSLNRDDTSNWKEVKAVYEFIILAQLMNGPAHGYLIAKIINDMIGPYTRISYGRLYPLLTKLEESGLIVAERETISGQPHDRQLRIFSITDAGRLRFQFLMNDTSLNPGDYQKLFAHKVGAFMHITSVERLRLIDHYINYCQTNIFHMRAESEDLLLRVVQVDDLHQKAPEVARGFPRLTPQRIESAVNVMHHYIDQWQLELEWARWLQGKEHALASRAGTDAEDIVGAEEAN